MNRRLTLAVALLALIVWLAAGATEEKPEPARLHEDARAMAEAVTDVNIALMRDDAESARAALKRLEEVCPRHHDEVDAVFGSGFRTLDQAMHTVLGNTIRYVGDGQLDRAFDEFVWVQRTCRQCHGIARERGFLPAEGPLWEPATSP